MMVRPTPRIARWSASTSFGMLVGGLMQLHTGFHGAGIASMLGLAIALCGLGALSVQCPLPSKRWRFALAGLPLLGWYAGDLLHGATIILHATIGATSAVSAIGYGIISLAALPAFRIGIPALRTGSGPGTPLMFIAGIWLAYSGLTQPTILLGAAVGLFLADTVSSPERGWFDTAYRPSFDGITYTFIAGLLASSGWVHLRSVFDPTTFGIVALLSGVMIGHYLTNFKISAPISGLAFIGGSLWLTLGWMNEIAPRVASWGFNQTETNIAPTLWLSLPFAILGLGLGPYIRGTTRAATSWLSLALGLWIGPSLLTDATLLWCSVGIAGLGVLAAKRYSTQALSVAVVLGLLGAESIVERTTAPVVQMGVWSKSNSARSLGLWESPPNDLNLGLTAIAPSGSIATWTDGERAPHLASTLDGLTRSNRGSLAQSEEMAGHLAALLAANQESVLLLGDELGNTLRGLAAHPTRIAQVAAPFPISVRFLGQADDVRKKLWIAPSSPLFPEHPASLLHRAQPVGSIIEISHTPWADGANMRWDAEHVRTVQSRLKPDGLYILCAHLRFWASNQPASIATTLLQTFEEVQVWSGPEGADSLLFVASNNPISYDTLTDRFNQGRIGLESMGFTSPEVLAGSALLGTDGARAWANTGGGLPPAGRLNATIFEKPVLHIGSISTFMDSHPDPWNAQAPDGVQEVRNARKVLINLLQKASEGQLEGAFSAARALATNHGTIGKAAISKLIEPHVNDARKAIAKARSDGPNSKHWNDALRFATTAKMLAPQHAETHTLLGELALAQGNTQQGWDHFSKALKLDPSHVPALDGLAQCARLEEDQTKAEQALRDATRHAPRDWQAWHNLAVFHLESNAPKKAMDAIETAIGLAETKEVAPLLVLTTILLRQGDAGAALLRAEQCTQLAPNNGLTWFLRGRAHYDLNRFNEAERDFRKAVLTDSELIEARGGIGMVRAILGDPNAAIAAFKDVLNRDPNNGAARENLRRLQLLIPDEAKP